MASPKKKASIQDVYDKLVEHMKQFPGDPPPLPGPPLPCDFGDLCESVKDIIQTIVDAPSGSMITTTDDGHIQATPPPTVNSVWSYNAATNVQYWNPTA